MSPSRWTGVNAVDHRDAPRPRACHPVGHVAQDLIGVGDGSGSDHGLATPPVGIVRSASTTDHGRTPSMRAQGRGRGRGVGAARMSPRARSRRSRRPRGLDGVDVGVHHLANEGGFEGVDGVLAHDMETPTGDLLGQDRPFEDEDAYEVRNLAATRSAKRLFGRG